MPCWNVVTNTLDLGDVARRRPELLEGALRAEFDNVQVTRGGGFAFGVYNGWAAVRDGRVTGRGLSEAQVAEVARRTSQAVGRAAVTLAAKRFGWAVERGADVNHFTITRR